MTTADRPMGVPVFDEGRWSVRYVRHLEHRREKVWRALTESEHLVHWLPADIVGERRAGASIELPFWAAKVERYDIEQPVLQGEIRVWDPPAVFEWTWDTDVLRWELEEDGDDATVLTFTTWFGEVDPKVTADAGAGYHVCLDQLAELLDRGASSPEVDEDVADLERRYTAAVTAAQRASAPGPAARQTS